MRLTSTDDGLRAEDGYWDCREHARSLVEDNVPRFGVVIVSHRRVSDSVSPVGQPYRGRGNRKNYVTSTAGAGAVTDPILPSSGGRGTGMPSLNRGG